MRLAGPQPDSRYGQHARSAAKINDARIVNNMAIQPFQAQCRRGVCPRSERQARIHPHDHCTRSSHFLVMWADPQTPPKAHCVKIPQPLALPNTVFDALDLYAARGNIESFAQPANDVLRVAISGEQRPQAGGWPEPKLTRQRLEYRIILSVHVRHRSRAQTETDSFSLVWIQRTQVERQLPEVPHGAR